MEGLLSTGPTPSSFFSKSVEGLSASSFPPQCYCLLLPELGHLGSKMLLISNIQLCYSVELCIAVATDSCVRVYNCV